MIDMTDERGHRIISRPGRRTIRPTIWTSGLVPNRWLRRLGRAVVVAGLTAAFAGGTGGLSPSEALASEGEHSFTAALRYTTMVADAEGADDLHGVAAGFDYRWGISDFWWLLADAEYALYPGAAGGPEHLGLVRAGAIYTIDAVAWVPWIGAGLGAYVLSDDGGSIDGGLSAGVGLDYRPRREYSFGVDAWYHLLFDRFDEIPATLTVGFRFSWYLRP